MLEEHEDLARNLGVNALVDQIHSSAVDLIGGTGLDRARPCEPCRMPPDALLREATAIRNTRN